jgi:hypothetical protein
MTFPSKKFTVHKASLCTVNFLLGKFLVKFAVLFNEISRENNKEFKRKSTVILRAEYREFFTKVGSFNKGIHNENSAITI